MAVIVNGKKVAGLGQPGKDGAPGKSAYQAAKEKGYTGTEEEFNTALAGMQSAPFLPLAGGVVTGNLILGVDSSSGSALYIGSENGAQVVFDSTWGLRVLADTIIFGQNSNDQKSLIFHNGQIKNLSLPGSPNDAANKQYVDEHAGARVVTGTYVGTNENALNINFPFSPLSVFIFQLNYVGGIDEYFSVVAPESDSLYFFDGSRGSRLIVSWSGNRLTIYTTNGTFNRTNAKYKYIAFG